MNRDKNKIIGSLIGGAIGDALGYPIEFKREIKEKEYTKYLNDKGIISDDTQMTLFTANGLLWRETRGAMRGIAPLPVDAIYYAYLDWLETQNSDQKNMSKVSWIKDLPELNVNRAPGNTCLSALMSKVKGTIEQPINNSKGCGGVMRVAPIGLYIGDSENAGKFGAEVSAITHGHPLGIIPSYFLSTMIYFIVNQNLNIMDSLNKAYKQFVEKYNFFDKKEVKYFIDLINKAIKLSKSNYSDIDAINELGEGWVAEEAFAIAIYSCLKYENSFEDAIICAVNHDGDSDSTGAIAGNIMGALLGLDAIPNYYIDNLELKDVIMEMGNDLSSDIPVGEYNDNNDEYWLSKYSSCKRNLELRKKKDEMNSGKQEDTIELVSETLKGYVSFDNDGYAFANQKLPVELELEYDNFINSYYNDENNKLVNYIVNEIVNLPYDVETTIAQLINYKPEEAFVSPMTQGIISNAVQKKCESSGIKLIENRDEFGGLAYNYKFKKIK